MKMYYNENDKYGDRGPYEAESKEALADELDAEFYVWASEQDTGDVASIVLEMKQDFIAGLVEVVR